MAIDDKDRLGERLRTIGSATEKVWAAKGDSALLDKLRQEAKEQKVREKKANRTPRAFNRILCAIDFARASQKALQLARQIAEENDAALYVVHICPTVAVPLGGTLASTPDAEQTARKRLEETAKRYLAEIPHELLVVMGDPVRRILEIQSALGIDLIVLGTHGRKGVPKFFLGSTADHVVREAACPVITTRGE